MTNLQFGLFAAAAGGLGLVKCAWDRIGSERIMGEVIGFAQRDGYPFPVIRFRYRGEELQLPTGNTEKRLSVGDQVEVIYKPKNPSYVHLTDNNRDIIVGVILLALGLIMIVLSLFFK